MEQNESKSTDKNLSEWSSEVSQQIDMAFDATLLPSIGMKQQLNESSEEFFVNLEDYFSSEIELTLDDYKLLETMNLATVEKYQEMKNIAVSVEQNMIDLSEKYEAMIPKLDIIDKLDKKVTQLEKMAYAIDAYSKKLEKQFKILEKGVVQENSERQSADNL